MTRPCPCPSSGPTHIPITLTTQLPIEIQCNILKFIIVNFLFSIRDTEETIADGRVTHNTYGLLGSLYGSNIIQAQLISLIGYDDVLDDITCMAIEEAELYLMFQGFDKYPHNSKLINFLSSRSVSLKSIELKSGARFRQPSSNLLKLIKFQSERVHLLVTYEGVYSEIKDAVWLKLVNSLNWTDRVQGLKTSGMVYKFNDLIELTVHLYEVGEISLVEDILHGLEQKSHPLKELRILFYPIGITEESISDCWTQLGNLITKNSKVNMLIFISFESSNGASSDWKLRSRIPSFPPGVLKYPVTTEEADNLEKWCRVSGLNHLSLHTSEDDISPVIHIPKSTIRSLILSYFSVHHKISFDISINLKQLLLFQCDLNQIFFSNLPESLKEIEIEACNYNTSSGSDNSIHLPLQLRSLKLIGNLGTFTLPTIFNIDQLCHLKKVSIQIYTIYIEDDSASSWIYDLNDSTTKEFLQISNNFALPQVQAFVDQLPNDLESLEIRTDGYFRTKPENYINICCPDALSFEHFTNLKAFIFNCPNNTGSFNVSTFPSVDVLKYDAPEHLNGCFSEGILNLHLDLTSYEEPLCHFLNTFVSKMTNLVSLYLVTVSCHSIDFREVKFPSRLGSFTSEYNFPYFDPEESSQVPGYIVLDGVPNLMSYFALKLFYGQTIVVDDCKGETIESMKDRLYVDRHLKCNWVQYSHFQDTEDYFFDWLYE
ncbi:unnamed protein product [Ambrosiozyma monospora]|uniref:Unnamed protein product n=1 Tax=Ambrosiozyma monospora TaxID=43982 RepID=A0ACB5SZK8_AMBMO|nr:unnamed protein product [Ambrosiozyma monospora]